MAFLSERLATDGFNSLWVTLAGFLFFVAALYRPLLLSLTILLMFIHPDRLPSVFEIAGMTIRAIDILMILLAMRLFVSFPVLKWSLRVTHSARRIFGVILVFLVYTGLTLLIPWRTVPEHFPIALISFFRLAASVALALILHMHLRSISDSQRLLSAITFGAMLNIGVAVGQWLTSGQSIFSANIRVDGLLGPNGLGLVSAVLLILSLGERMHRMGLPAVVRIGGIPLALLGLLLAKSVSSFLAGVAGALTILLVSQARRIRVQRAFAAAGLGVVIGLLLVVTRWPDIRGVVTLTEGSFTHRLVVGYVGLLIFFAHPIFGVGWQTSWAPSIISDPSLNRAAYERFGVTLQIALLPEQTPTQVHNFYIQVLAESGIIGVILWGAIVAVVIRECRVLVLSNDPHIRNYCWIWISILVALAFWFNTNPLYGGQVESFLLFSALAALCALPRANYVVGAT